MPDDQRRACVPGSAGFSLRVVHVEAGWQHASHNEQHARAPQQIRTLEQRQRAIDACHHLLFSENLQQMIQTRSYAAAGHGKASGMNDRADFDAEL